MILAHPWGLDYSTLQQQFPNLQPPTTHPSFLTGNFLHDPTVGNHPLSNFSSRHSQQSHREHDPRSLLGKYVHYSLFKKCPSNQSPSLFQFRIIRDDQGVNTDSKNELRKIQEQDHISYLQSILLSTMLTTSDEEQQQQNHS